MDATTLSTSFSCSSFSSAASNSSASSSSSSPSLSLEQVQITAIGNDDNNEEQQQQQQQQEKSHRSLRQFIIQDLPPTKEIAVYNSSTSCHDDETLIFYDEDEENGNKEEDETEEEQDVEEDDDDLLQVPMPPSSNRTLMSRTSVNNTSNHSTTSSGKKEITTTSTPDVDSATDCDHNSGSNDSCSSDSTTSRSSDDDNNNGNKIIKRWYVYLILNIVAILWGTQHSVIKLVVDSGADEEYADTTDGDGNSGPIPDIATIQNHATYPALSVLVRFGIAAILSSPSAPTLLFCLPRTFVSSMFRRTMNIGYWWSLLQQKRQQQRRQNKKQSSSKGGKKQQKQDESDSFATDINVTCSTVGTTAPTQELETTLETADATAGIDNENPIPTTTKAPASPSLDAPGEASEEVAHQLTDAEVSYHYWKWGGELGLWLFMGFAWNAIALTWTSAQRAGFLLYLNVKFVPFFAWLFYKKRIAPTVWCSAAVALVGTALLTLGNGNQTPVNVGDALAVVSAMASAMFILRLEAASNALKEVLSSSSSLTPSTVSKEVEHGRKVLQRSSTTRTTATALTTGTATGNEGGVSQEQQETNKVDDIEKGEDKKEDTSSECKDITISAPTTNTRGEASDASSSSSSPVSSYSFSASSLHATTMWTVAFLSVIWTGIAQVVIARRGDGENYLIDTFQDLFQNHFWGILYLATVPTAICGFLQTSVQHYVPSEHAALIYSMDPVYGAFISHILLGETLGGPLGYIGAFLIVLAALTGILLVMVDIPRPITAMMDNIMNSIVTSFAIASASVTAFFKNVKTNTMLALKKRKENKKNKKLMKIFEESKIKLQERSDEENQARKGKGGRSSSFCMNKNVSQRNKEGQEGFEHMPATIPSTNNRVIRHNSYNGLREETIDEESEGNRSSSSIQEQLGGSMASIINMCGMVSDKNVKKKNAFSTQNDFDDDDDEDSDDDNDSITQQKNTNGPLAEEEEMEDSEGNRSSSSIQERLGGSMASFISMTGLVSDKTVKKKAVQQD